MSKRLKTTQTLERFLSRVNHHMSPQISFTFEIAGWANWTGKWHVSTVFHNMDLKVATVQALVVAVWTNIHLASSPRLSGVYCDRLDSWLSLRVVRECACLNHCIHLWNNILLTTEAQFNFASIQSLIQRLLAQASLIKLKPSKENFFFQYHSLFYILKNLVLYYGISSIRNGYAEGQYHLSLNNNESKIMMKD